MLAFAALGGFLFLNTLYLQDVRGYSALHAGLLTIPMAAMLGVLSHRSRAGWWPAAGRGSRWSLGRADHRGRGPAVRPDRAHPGVRT